MEEKIWIISNNILQYSKEGELFSPTADDIYSAVFEKKFTNTITENDFKHLKNILSFSRYPATLKIRLSSSEGKICATINAYNPSGSFAEINPNVDHIIIEKKWFAVVRDSVEEIIQTFFLSTQSKKNITLREYFELIKIESDDIDNKVDLKDSQELIPKENFPAVSAKLYSYQEKGWQWLLYMSKEGVGGILADEMGLGKTLQIITLITSLVNIDSFFLIIAPTSLLENWNREFNKFSPNIKVVIHQGAARTGFPNELRNYSVVITSYETAVRDFSLLNQIKWTLIICDEAQAIKNPSAKRTISIKQLNRSVAFAVTGTPIENSLTDLWSLIDLTTPGYLGTRTQFESKFDNSSFGALELEELVSPLILKRKVIEVAQDLPAKILIPQIIQLSEIEENMYEEIRLATLNEYPNNASLVSLIRLRMLCTHPQLISKDSVISDPNESCNKYSRLVEILDEIFANGAKALIFTSFNKMNDILTTDIKKRFNVYTHSIDGRTQGNERQKIVDQFSSYNGPAALILNPIAAGTGLNITAANHVIHYNLEWNPAKEDQASARAYRRGQDRPVTIHRLIYANTVDEVINERISRKRDIASAAIIGVKGDESDYKDILNALSKTPKGFQNEK